MIENTKVLGILGLGIRSTQFYIDELNKRYHQKHGNYHTLPCLVNYVDFNELNPFLPDRFDILIPALTDILNAFFQLPIERCLIPNITLHETYDLAKLNHNIIHPIELAIAYIKQRRISSVVLMGSKYTMNSKYIPSRLASHDITVHRPSEAEMTIVDNFRTKLYSSSETQNDIEIYDAIINDYTKTNYVLIACTELSIHNLRGINDKTIDLAELQIENALQF